MLILHDEKDEKWWPPPFRPCPSALLRWRPPYPFVTLDARSQPSTPWIFNYHCDWYVHDHQYVSLFRIRILGDSDDDLISFSVGSSFTIAFVLICLARSAEILWLFSSVFVFVAITVSQGRETLLVIYIRRTNGCNLRRCFKCFK